MAWGDSWGSSPSEYHHRLAAAFFEGRQLGSVAKGTYVDSVNQQYMVYVYDGRQIARYTPPVLIPDLVARKLEGKKFDVYTEMVFCTVQANKAEARHLRALGVDAEWQWGGNPFLAFGADVSTSPSWLTIEGCKALPKWEAPAAPVRKPRFVNLTAPLFA